jgi:hypothetical protein
LCHAHFSFLGSEIDTFHQKISGGKEYKKFLDGKKLTRKEAMLAHCYECMGGFEEGKQDCQGKSCPLYQFYPYQKVLQSA